jgi:hypothetical protein
VKRLALITVVLGSALALVPFASAVVLLDGGSSGSVARIAPATDPATQAVLLRSQGLSSYYSTNAVTVRPDVLGGKGTPLSTSVSTGDSFNWSNALAITLAGMLILAIAATTMTRRRHQPSF